MPLLKLTNFSFAYTQLTILLKNHFTSKKMVITERYRFLNRTQREGQSVTALAANLKHPASTCQFSNHLNEALRDRFVCGLRSKETQKKLLTEEHTFDSALKVARPQRRSCRKRCCCIFARCFSFCQS